MPARIDIQYTTSDARAKTKQKAFESLGFLGKIKAVSILDSYLIDAKLSLLQLRKAAEILTNPLIENYQINKPLAPKKFDFAIEVGFLPGVTDNIGTTVQQTIEDLLKKRFRPGEKVYSSQVFFISDKLKEEEIKVIAGALYNPLIQRAQIKTQSQFKKGGFGKSVPKVNLKAGSKVLSINLEVSDEELSAIGQMGIKDAAGRRGPLALDLQYMKTIQAYFKKLGRSPTDVELESIAQTWSEHCKHTIFASPMDELKEGIYKTYIKQATNIIRAKKGSRDFCASVFTDNAGAIEFDQDYLISHKVETHNTPSALDPFGGAITGIVGVNRDALGFGLGAKPVANTYGFCFADPKDKRVLYRDKNLTQKMLSPKRIMQGVVAGINAGGNQSGIPTVQGFMYFDESYRGKPLVFAGTVGLIPKKIGGKSSVVKKALPGDYIVMVGGRVGLDGIHGATFSSTVLDSGSPATAVQIGDPITQKKFSDALVKEARDLGLYHSITDDGAGGLSCSVAEMAKESGGCLVFLDKVPVKYPGLAPWQIWVSESQERMTLAVPKNKWQKFNKLMASRGVEASVIGQFTNSGKCVVKFHKATVMDLPLDFLHNGLPQKHLLTKALKIIPDVQNLPRSQNLSQQVLNLLKRLNLTSNEFVSQQYDHEVQSSSVQKPLVGRGRVSSEASVFRPVLNSKKGVVMSCGINPKYSEIDSYNMAACAIDTAIRNSVAAGANLEHMALLDNFCWCSSNDPHRLYQLKQAAKACYDLAVLYETPFISGKDSMFNDFKGFDEQGREAKVSILPTLLISAISVVPDINKTVSLDAKFVGDLVYVLGDTRDELAGSEYLQMLLGQSGGQIPKVDALKNRKLYLDFYSAAQRELISSAISVGRGGLAIALSKMAMAGNLGLEASLKGIPGTPLDDQIVLFSESQGRILVSIEPKHQQQFEEVMAGNSFSLIGKITSGSQIRIGGQSGKNIVNLKLSEALQAYKSTFKNY